MIKIIETRESLADYKYKELQTRLPQINGATLLEASEANNFISVNDRAYWGEWWLRRPGYCDDTVSVVASEGIIYYAGYDVEETLYVRPALQISNLESSDFEVGDLFNINGYDFKIIFKKLAWLYGQDIGKTYFNKKEYGNDYETSNVKKYVDDWFNTEIKPYV